MKIGVFGDSFAILKLNPTPTWVDILSKKYDITNHAVTGSNLYYSVEEIKKHYHLYDKIILVVTEQGRLKISNLIPLGRSQQFVNGPLDQKYLHRTELSKYEKLVWEAANQYFTCLQDDDYDRYIHNLMLDNITKIRPDIILIPAFQNSWYNINSNFVQDIYYKENTAWDFDSTTVITQYRDNRNCHMTAENNEIFATKAEQWINGKPVHINLDDFVTTTNKDFYLTKI
jgi:hypothetical protein